MSKFYIFSSRLYDYSKKIFIRKLETINILKISLFFMGFWVSLLFLSTAPASACELAKGITSQSPAIWLDFNGQGTPANLGNRAIAIQPSGPSPKYGVSSPCGSAYDFSSNAGGYFFNEVAGGSLFNDGEFTIEALFSINRQTSIDYPTIFIADKQGLPGAIIIRVRTDGSNAGRLEVAMFSNNEIGFYTKKTVDDGNWHHIVVTLGNGKLSAYIDGEYMGANVRRL